MQIINKKTISFFVVLLLIIITYFVFFTSDESSVEVKTVDSYIGDIEKNYRIIKIKEL